MLTKYDDYKWIKVARFNPEPMLSANLKFELLWNHHIDETTFLVNEVRELAALLKETETFFEMLLEYFPNDHVPKGLLAKIKKKIN